MKNFRWHLTWTMKDYWGLLKCCLCQNQFWKFRKIKRKWGKGKLSDHEQLETRIMWENTQNYLIQMFSLPFSSAREHDLYREKTGTNLEWVSVGPISLRLYLRNFWVSTNVYCYVWHPSRAKYVKYFPALFNLGIYTKSSWFDFLDPLWFPSDFSTLYLKTL